MKPAKTDVGICIISFMINLINIKNYKINRKMHVPYSTYFYFGKTYLNKYYNTKHMNDSFGKEISDKLYEFYKKHNPGIPSEKDKWIMHIFFKKHNRY